MLQWTISTNVTAKIIFCLAIPRVTSHVKRSVKTDYVNESREKLNDEHLTLPCRGKASKTRLE
jgi:hypothetical protein